MIRTLAVIAASCVVLFLLCYFAFTRKRGGLVLVAWVVVPLLTVVIDACVTSMAIDARRCGHEDYLCLDWPPTAVMHLITLLLAIGAPVLLTIIWLRERRRRRHQATER